MAGVKTDGETQICRWRKVGQRKELNGRRSGGKWRRGMTKRSEGRDGWTPK